MKSFTSQAPRRAAAGPRAGHWVYTALSQSVILSLIEPNKQLNKEFVTGPIDIIPVVHENEMLAQQGAQQVCSIFSPCA